MAPRFTPRQMPVWLSALAALIAVLGGIFPALSQEAVALGQVAGGQLKEISGMVASHRHPGILWVHNDGADGRLFAVHTNGQVHAVFRLTTPVEDLEDLARGPGPDVGKDYLYLGDMGDNDSRRSSIRVVRVAEPEPRPGTSPKQPAPLNDLETLTLRYPDGARDAEALLCDPRTGQVLVVTKEKRRARFYGVAATAWGAATPVSLAFLGEVPFASVSAGDLSPDGQRVLLRREDAAWVWARTPGESWSATLAKVPQRVPVVGPPEEPNGEAAGWAPHGQGYFTLSEGKRQPIHYFALPASNRSLP